jgi:diguanylate cyclase (GGDEF)-like protein
VSSPLPSPSARVSWHATAARFAEVDRGQRATAALLLVPADELAERAPQLAAHEEICTVDDPLPLIAHRLRRLIDRVAITERDALTGLLSRPVFRRELDRQLPRASADQPLSLLLLDLDHFKKINDEHGHQIGDEVLRAWARCTTECCPSPALVARIGGEELAVFLDADEPEALALATLLCEELRRRPRTEHQLRITVSIGVASAAQPASAEALLRQADQALYAAKAEGRNRVVHFSELEREAFRQDEDLDLFAFENVTRVIAERIAELITRRGRRLFRDLKAQADFDGLTGLYARRYLDRRLEFEFGETTRRDAPLTVALLDIDHFGEVNKERGWPTGDRVLRQLAELLRSNTRGSDWVARYGGEEFCLVMPDTALSVAARVLERIRLAVARTGFDGPDQPTAPRQAQRPRPGLLGRRGRRGLRRGPAGTF